MYLYFGFLIFLTVLCTILCTNFFGTPHLAYQEYIFFGTSHLVYQEFYLAYQESRFAY